MLCSVRVTSNRFETTVLNSDNQAPFYELRLTLVYERVGWPIFYEFGGTTVILILCAYALHFVDYRVPPALIGAVTSSVLLLVLTNSLRNSLMERIPAGTDTFYLGEFLRFSVFCQGLNIPAHILRMQWVSDKTCEAGSWQYLVTRCMRVAALAIFVFGELIITAAYLFERLSTLEIAVLNILAAVTFVVSVGICANNIYTYRRSTIAASRLEDMNRGPDVPDGASVEMNPVKTQQQLEEQSESKKLAETLSL